VADTYPFLETVLAKDGRLPRLPWHQARLERTCAANGIRRSFDLASLIDPPERGTFRCRFLYGDAGWLVEFHPYVFRPPRALKIIRDDTIDYRFKSTDRRRLNALFERRGEADDVLIVRRGLVTDTTVANTAFRIDGVWLTPQTPLLEGTARARLIAEGKLIPAAVTETAARNAEKVAVMNALSGFVELEAGILSDENGADSDAACTEREPC